MALLSSNSDGSIQIKDGIIIVENPTGEGKPAVIFSSENMNIVMDGKFLNGKVEVFSHNNIEVIFEENEASRNLDIEISEDAMEAWISTPGNTL